MRRTFAAPRLSLQGMDCETAMAADRKSALQQLNQENFEVIFLDLKLNNESGLELLPELLKTDPRPDVVVFTAYASIENAVEAMSHGLSSKAFTPEQIRQVLGKICSARKLRARFELESHVSSITPNTDLATREPVMQKVFDLAFKAASTSANN